MTRARSWTRRCTSSTTGTAAAWRLRPEGTAPVVRVFIEHHPVTPWKAWYVTPAFRHEQPQAGRYRQHHQVGVEAIGTDDPDLDVEVVALAASLYRDIGLQRVSLAVNSMGCAECRASYVEALRAYLVEHRDELCDEHRDKLDRPLRVLDCKRPECRQVTENAPRIVDWLDEDCAAHFARFNSGLDALGIEHHTRAAPREGLRLLHADHLRVRLRGSRRRTERGRRGRALRRPRGAARRAAHCRASDSASA